MKTTTNLFVVAAAEKTHRIYIYFFPSLLFILRGFWRHITERRGRGDRDSRYKVHPKLVVLSPAIVFFLPRILKATTRCFWGNECEGGDSAWVSIACMVSNGLAASGLWVSWWVGG